MKFCIKVVVLNRSDPTKRNQSENDDIPQDMRFAHVIINYFFCCIFNRYN